MYEPEYWPVNPRDKEDEVPIDLRAVDEFVNVAGIHSLSWHQWSCADAVTRYRSEIQSKQQEAYF